jgi:hypothetical protein
VAASRSLIRHSPCEGDTDPEHGPSPWARPPPATARHSEAASMVARGRLSVSGHSPTALDRVCHPCARSGTQHVDIGVCGQVGGPARADLETDRHHVRFVDQVMPVASTLRKGRAIAGAQHGLAAILDQGQLALEHIDEFVLVRMPVALARPVARRQAHEIDPEISDPTSIAQPLPHTVGTGDVEGRRIARAFAFRDGRDVDLGHGSLPALSGHVDSTVMSDLVLHVHLETVVLRRPRSGPRRTHRPNLAACSRARRRQGPRAAAPRLAALRGARRLRVDADEFRRRR